MPRALGQSLPPSAGLPLSPLRPRQENTSFTDHCLPPNVTYPSCTDVSNSVRSCYPTASTVIAQDSWTKFVWNPNLPDLAQFGRVDVYLFHEDSQIQVSNWTRVTTGQSSVSSCADDAWLGTQGLNFTPGKDILWPFYFVVVASGTPLTGAEPQEPTFFLRQTAPLDSVASSTAAAASSASVASAQASDTGSLQGNANSQSDSSFPHWAIALLAVLGFLTLLGFVLFGYVLVRDIRARKRRRQRESIGSESPMMAAVPPTSPPQSPTRPDVAGSIVAGRTGSLAPQQRSIRGLHDASSTTSRAGSAGESVPFTGAEAAIISDAFRNALRKPDFADQVVEEGESPDQPEKEESTGLLNRELAEEGRDIRSVRSERGVKVENLEDTDDTAL